MPSCTTCNLWGVTSLYLNPIFDSPSNHKYDTQDYFKVDAHLGSNEQFAELTRNLHQRGMKIILDAVVNHTSIQPPWFCPPLGAQSNPDSPWPSFYTFDNESITSAGRAFAAYPSSTSPARRCRTPSIGLTMPSCATGCAPFGAPAACVR